MIFTNNVNKKPIWFFEFGISPTEFNCARISQSGANVVVFAASFYLYAAEFVKQLRAAGSNAIFVTKVNIFFEYKKNQNLMLRNISRSKSDSKN